MELETAALDATTGWSAKRDTDADLQVTFEAFKEANDQRLTDIENSQTADIVLEEKVERINQRLSQLTTQLQRPALETAGPEEDGEREIRAAFRDYVTTGNTDALSAIQTKTLRGTSDVEGGYLIPDSLQLDLENKLKASTPFRGLARHLEVASGNEVTYVTPTGQFGSSWASETQGRVTTSTPTFQETRIELNEIYASPAASTHFLSDSSADIEGWLIGELAEAFAAVEGLAFIAGNGIDQPHGLMNESLTYTASAVGTKVLARKSGAASSFKASAPSDVLVELAYGLPPQYRQNASWLMNANTQATIRKFKDSSDNYLWTPGHGDSFTPTLLGFPLYEDQNMPDVATGTSPIAFGDFKQAYTIIERNDPLFIRDPYSMKPYVLFYGSRRVGGRVVNRYAYQVLRITT